MDAVVAWQSNIAYFSKSAGQKLIELERTFGFKIDSVIVEDHENLAGLRWELQSRIGKNNPYSTRALSKLFFAYLKHGSHFLDDNELTRDTINSLAEAFGRPGVHKGECVGGTPGTLETLGGARVNELMREYHFLGYGRSDGWHVGLRSRDGAGDPLAIASFSAWDISHADLALRRLEVDRSEVLVLTRLLSVPGGRITLSQFIAQLVKWVRRELPHIRIIASYCNPNAGHYGTVYRGANFRPLCLEEHPFVPFRAGDYVSPRQLAELCRVHGVTSCERMIDPSAFKPIPLLLYYYPVRRSRRAQHVQVPTCSHPYPFALSVPRHGVQLGRPRQ
jgi:hypothetical protein